MTDSTRFAVIGAGVAGLAAAWELGRNGNDVVVFEADDRIGGKIHATHVPGIERDVEAAADAFLARVPDGLDVCAALGIDDLVNPAARHAFIYGPNGVHPLPAGQLLGLPTDLDEIATSGVLSADGLARAREDLGSTASPIEVDVSVGELIRTRLGDEVLVHLVEPLLAGINAGEADDLSVQACAPQIWQCARAGGSLIEAAAAMRARSVDPSAPVFAAPRAGMTHLTGELARQSGAEIRLSTRVRTISTLDGAVEVDGEHFAGAVIATPASATAALLGGVAPDAAAALDTIDFASVVMVTFVLDRDAVDHPLDGSGIVVTRDAGVSITAISFATSKWAHLDDGRHAILRVSLGHIGDPVDWPSRGNEELAATALADVETVLGVEGITPVGVRVGRWVRSFPQYRPGHADLVAGAHMAVAAAGPIRLAGASLEGLGVPACLRQGRAAAQSLLGG